MRRATHVLATCRGGHLSINYAIFGVELTICQAVVKHMNLHSSSLISAKNAAQQAVSIQRELYSRFSYIIFFPEMVNLDDLQIPEFCSHIRLMKSFVLDHFSKQQEIVEIFTMIPQVTEDDFAIDNWNIPSYILYVLLPVGFAIWLIRYRKLSALQNKLSLTESKLNTGIFYLNAFDY